MAAARRRAELTKLSACYGALWYVLTTLQRLFMSMRAWVWMLACAAACSASDQPGNGDPQFGLSPVPVEAVTSGSGCAAVNANDDVLFLTDHTRGAIQLRGQTITLASREPGDATDGGQFDDEAQGIGVRIALNGAPTQVDAELSSTPATLHLTADGAEHAVAVNYECGS